MQSRKICKQQLVFISGSKCSSSVRCLLSPVTENTIQILHEDGFLPKNAKIFRFNNYIQTLVSCFPPQTNYCFTTLHEVINYLTSLFRKHNFFNFFSENVTSAFSFFNISEPQTTFLKVTPLLLFRLTFPLVYFVALFVDALTFLNSSKEIASSWSRSASWMARSAMLCSCSSVTCVPSIERRT